MRHRYTTTLERMALVIPEQRLDLGVSQSELSRLSGVIRSTIAKLEAGRRIDPRHVVDLAGCLLVAELYGALRLGRNDLDIDLIVEAAA